VRLLAISRDARPISFLPTVPSIVPGTEKSWKRVFHDRGKTSFGRRESLSFGKPRDSRAGDNERVRAPSSRRGFTRRLGGNALAAFSIGLFRPVSPISHSRAKDDQNDFCAAATATTGVKETGASIARAIPVIIFSHFSAEIILETNGPLKAPDRIINLSSRRARSEKRRPSG